MKGNTDCHIPNSKYRDNYDSIFGREKKVDKKTFNVQKKRREKAKSDAQSVVEK